MKTSNLKLQHVYPYASMSLRDNHESRLGDPHTPDRTSTPFMVVTPKHLPDASKFATQATFYLNEHDSILELANACKVAHEASEEFLRSILNLLLCLKDNDLSSWSQEDKSRLVEVMHVVVGSDGSVLFDMEAVREVLVGSAVIRRADVEAAIDWDCRKLRGF